MLVKHWEIPLQIQNKQTKRNKELRSAKWDPKEPSYISSELGTLRMASTAERPNLFSCFLPAGTHSPWTAHWLPRTTKAVSHLGSCSLNLQRSSTPQPTPCNSLAQWRYNKHLACVRHCVRSWSDKDANIQWSMTSKKKSHILDSSSRPCFQLRNADKGTSPNIRLS